MKHRKVTAKDVAARAGVSAATVSLILSGKGSNKFPEKTCRRVIDACSELGYVRNSAARTPAGGKLLLAVTPSYSNLYYVHMVEAMQTRAKELGYSLVAFDTFREIQQETRIMQLCSQFPFAGVLLLYPPENQLMKQQTEWNKPVIHIYDKSLYDDTDMLEFDGFRVGVITGEYLRDLGHTKVAFVSSTFDTRQATRIRRLEGLRSVYREAGLNPEKCVRAFTPDNVLQDVKNIPEDYDLGYQIARRLLENREDVTAFVTVNDMMAIGVMDAVREAGRRIPEEYSVCGCDNTTASRYSGISLTTVESYPRQTGVEAVNLLVRKIEGSGRSAEEDSPSGITRIEYFPRLIVRKSTGPCRNSQ